MITNSKSGITLKVSKSNERDYLERPKNSEK